MLLPAFMWAVVHNIALSATQRRVLNRWQWAQAVMANITSAQGLAWGGKCIGLFYKQLLPSANKSTKAGIIELKSRHNTQMGGRSESISVEMNPLFDVSCSDAHFALSVSLLVLKGAVLSFECLQCTHILFKMPYALLFNLWRGKDGSGKVNFCIINISGDVNALWFLCMGKEFVINDTRFREVNRRCCRLSPVLLLLLLGGQQEAFTLAAVDLFPVLCLMIAAAIEDTLACWTTRQGTFWCATESTSTAAIHLAKVVHLLFHICHLAKFKFLEFFKFR